MISGYSRPHNPSRPPLFFATQTFAHAHFNQNKDSPIQFVLQKTTEKTFRIRGQCRLQYKELALYGVRFNFSIYVLLYRK